MTQQPQIMISASDYDLLYEMLEKLPDSEATEKLAGELERAEIIDAESMPSDVVTMHSTVMFTILSSQKSFTYKLVYPSEAKASELLSILTPVGSALIGLSVGQEIEWPLGNNRSTTVRIDKVLH